MTTRFRSVALVPALLALLAGCAPRGPVFSPVAQPPEEKALVYIYRVGVFGGGVVYTVRTGSTDIVDLQTGGYYPYLADPGEREFWARTEARTTATENLRAGEIYYLKGGIGLGFFVGHPQLSFVDRETGEREIRDCHLIAK